jgi:hypothetical protein
VTGEPSGVVYCLSFSREVVKIDEKPVIIFWEMSLATDIETFADLISYVGHLGFVFPPRHDALF